jgi:hypothetical protein
MNAPRDLMRAACFATLLLLGCTEQSAGVDVSVDVSAFPKAESLRIVFTASPGGFTYQAPSNPEGKARVTTEDVEGNGEYALVTQFLVSPTAPKVNFRVTTSNRIGLSIKGRALVFDNANLIAKGEQVTPLAGGGAASLAIALTANTDQILSPSTRTTDLGTAPADYTVRGGAEGRPIESLAVCDLDGDGKKDFVLGIPSAGDTTLGQTGAVYVIFGDGGATPSLDVATAAKEFHFFGKNGADRLGAAVACADLDNDGTFDLIAGAPGVGGNKGAVYAVLGRQALPRTTIDWKAEKVPEGQWSIPASMTPGGARLGAVLFTADLDGDKRAEIMASAPGAAVVHLLTKPALDKMPVDLDTFAHTTFSGVSAKSIAAGDFATPDGLPNDVVFGDPEFAPPNATMKSGVIYVFRKVGLATPTAYTATPGTNGPAITMVGANGMQFGAAVLAIDTTGFRQDLFVGAPTGGELGRGQVLIYEHNDSFFNAPMRAYTDYKRAPLTGSVDNGHFGLALAASPNGANASWRLIVGAPDARRGTERTLAGAAYMFGSDAARSFPLLDEVYGAAKGDNLGAVVVGAQVDSTDTQGDLVALAPHAAGTNPGAGVVYVKRGQ